MKWPTSAHSRVLLTSRLRISLERGRGCGSPPCQSQAQRTPAWKQSPLLERVARIVFIVLLTRSGAAVHVARLHSAFQWEAAHRALATMKQGYEMFRPTFAQDDPMTWPRPGSTEVLHVSPHGRNAEDVLPLPDGQSHVRSSFWLNQSFVQLLIRLNDE